MNSATLTRGEGAEAESADLDFKSEFNSAVGHDWCEFVKDLVAMANSGGGLVVFGVNDDGTPAATDLTDIGSLDPAVVVDKVSKYTGQNFAAFSREEGTRGGMPVVIVEISQSCIPLVFTAPGTYDVGGGKQKTAFGKGTVYFRHGAKSEPGTSDDLRVALDRELDRIRGSWLDGIKKVVTAPAGATISVLPAEVHLSGGEGATGARLVNDESAPAFKAFRTDLLYPYRQKELVARVNALLAGPNIIGHDIYCVRKVHSVDAQPNFFYKPQFSSPQYSEAFAEWLVEQYRAEENFFHAAREAVKKPDAS